jgi:hypothetical protein
MEIEIHKTTKRNGEIVAKRIDAKVGSKLIRENHYSKKNVNTSTLYLGLYKDGVLLGVASLGIAMNPNSCQKTVPGTKINEYLELNRLWICDSISGNIESTFLGMCFKYIQKNLPKIRWVQSFADGRVGVGTIYQATNFDYYGYHITKFWQDTRTNEVYHNSVLTRKTRKKYYELQAILTRLQSFQVKTYRYIYFFNDLDRQNCKFKKQPYPKKDFTCIN